MQATAWDHRLNYIKLYCSYENADYIDNGIPVTYDYNRALAAIRLSACLIKEYVLLTDKYDKLYNSYGFYGGNHERIYNNSKYDINYGDWTFKTTDKTVFDQYIKFLRTKDTLHLLIAERNNLRYAKPYLEIFQQ